MEHEDGGMRRNRTLQRKSREFAEVYDQWKSLDDRLSELKADLRDLLEDYGEESFENKHVSLKMVTRTQFDGARFRKEHPQLHEEFQRETSSIRVGRARIVEGK